MRTEDVLAQIDQALEDWEVGPDAMRCSAPPEVRPPLRRFNGFPRTWPARDAAWLWPSRQANPTLGPRTIGVLSVTIAANAARAAAAFEEAMARTAAAMAITSSEATARLAALVKAFQLPPPHDAHHPRPLPIDGHAYHRRRRNRRNRR